MTTPFGIMAYDGTEPPHPTSPYYFAAAQAIYYYEETALCNVWTPTKRHPEGLLPLPKLQENGWMVYTAPDIPAELLGTIVNFFRAIYKRSETEAEVFLLYHPNKDPKWIAWVPPQEASAAHVKSHFHPNDLPPDYYIVGTVHSHCNFAAFHSGTDINDASTIPGIHITIGHIDNPIPDYAVMVTINQINFNFTIEQVAEEPDLTAQYPPEWLDKVTEEIFVLPSQLTPYPTRFPNNTHKYYKTNRPHLTTADIHNQIADDAADLIAFGAANGLTITIDAYDDHYNLLNLEDIEGTISAVDIDREAELDRWMNECIEEDARSDMLWAKYNAPRWPTP